ncbi:MAG: hypothetical protein K8963_02215, partial [Proteobacteria bacterium]|nr:hypothetical protein [Pseudomonadota bacterium]
AIKNLVGAGAATSTAAATLKAATKASVKRANGQASVRLPVLGFPLVRLLQASFDSYNEQGLITPEQARLTDLTDFILKRMAIWHQSYSGLAPNVIEAAIGGIPLANLDFATIDRRISCVARLLADKSVNRTILTAFKRIRNILREVTVTPADRIQPDLFETEQEKQLWQWWNKDQASAPQEEGESTVNRFVELAQILESFFEQVMVQCEDPDTRSNRQLLLARVGESMTNFADFSKLI